MLQPDQADYVDTNTVRCSVKQYKIPGGGDFMWDRLICMAAD
jgi:hypothetical protein